MKKPQDIRIVQFEARPCAPAENAERMVAAIRQARADGVALVVFPACAIQGLHPGAAEERDAFIDDCSQAVEMVAAASAGISVLFRSLLRDDDGLPVDWHILAEDGKIVAFGEVEVATALTSAYAGSFAVVAPDAVPEAADEVAEMGKEAGFIVVCGRERYDRSGIVPLGAPLSELAAATRRPVFYANHVGVADCGKCVEIYRGDSAVFDVRGRRVALAPPFVEDTPTLSAAACRSRAALPEIPLCAEEVADWAEALRHGLRAFMDQTGIRRVVIGVSGGIDSAVSTALYGSLLKPEDILLVSMPGPFTSGTTRDLAHALARNLGARFAEIPIGDGVELTRRQFAELVTQGPHGAMAGAWSLSSFALENVQARDRGSRVLAAAAAAFGGVVSCNANKDECTVGYGTLYGDITGWLCCLGDLWKGDVYALGRYLNEGVFGREIIPEGIFSVKPSAELSERQAVEKGLGDPLVYPYHDALFAAWTEGGETPDSCLAAYANGELEELIGYDGDIGRLFPSPADFVADIERWWGLYCGLAVAKRLQAPPVLAIGHAPFGARPETQARPYYGSRYRVLKERLLAAAPTTRKGTSRPSSRT